MEQAVETHSKYTTLKVYEPDQDRDYKGYRIESSIHDGISRWKEENNLPTMTAAFRKIYETAVSVPMLKQRIKSLQDRLEIYQGKANLAGINLSNPLTQSVEQQVQSKVQQERIQDEIKELKERLEKSENKLAKASAKYKKAKKKGKLLESELNGKSLDLNGILTEAIRNPTAITAFVSGLQNGGKGLQGLPEGNAEAEEFLEWFDGLFPDEEDQSNVVTLLKLLSANKKNITRMLNHLQHHTHPKQEEDGED
jgi:hypothetical protein